MAEEVQVWIPGDIWKAPVKLGDAAAGCELFIMEVMKTGAPRTRETGGAVAQVNIEQGQEGVGAGMVAAVIGSKRGNAIMIAASLSQSSLAAALWPARGAKAVARGVALAVFGSLLLWLSAKVQVPFWPVPMTMQTFVVLIIGASYGWRLGGVTVLAYLAEGAVGLPVFAGGGGVAYFGGPTGGFLLGFVLAAMVAGALMSWGRSPMKTIGAMLLAEIALFVPGLLWLGNFLAAAREVSFMAGMDAAIAAGLTPFLLAEALKIALVAAALPIAWKAAARRG